MASAEQYVPTRFNDPAPNGCKPDDCSLREAIKAANNHGGQDKVILSGGTYKMQIPPSSGGIDDGDFNVGGVLTIKGKGPTKTEVDGRGLDRVFTSAGTTKFLGMKITGGDSYMDPQHTSVGGGVAAFGDKLVLKNVTVSENYAQLGGGISSGASELSIVRSYVVSNRAVEGAGLHLRSAITQPVTNIRATTFDGNAATQKGGGILADGATVGPNAAEPFLIVENSTIAGNFAGGGTGTNEGGGILGDNGAIVSLDQTTVYFNKAGGTTAAGGIGGGLYQHSGAIFNPGDSIIYENGVGSGGMVRTNVADAQCTGTFNGSGGNLVQQLVGTTCTITGGYTETTDAKLGFPGNYGGPTLVIPLLAGSPAIGLAETCPPKDQRGVARPITNCDSGAFENIDP